MKRIAQKGRRIEDADGVAFTPFRYGQQSSKVPPPQADNAM
jgi:hypothetical protein